MLILSTTGDNPQQGTKATRQDRRKRGRRREVKKQERKGFTVECLAGISHVIPSTQETEAGKKTILNTAMHNKKHSISLGSDTEVSLAQLQGN